MSYLCDGTYKLLYPRYGSTDWALSGAYNLPITFGFFMRLISKNDNEYHQFMEMRSSSGSSNGSIGGYIQRTGPATTDWLGPLSRNTTGLVDYCARGVDAGTWEQQNIGKTYNAESGWFPCLMELIGTGTTVTAYQVRVGLYDLNWTTYNDDEGGALGAQLGYIYFGTVSAADTWKLAEVALWNAILSEGEATDYLGGVPASLARSSDLIAYWPMRTDGTQAAGSDSAGTLYESGAVLDKNDNPRMVMPLSGSVGVARRHFIL
jgi:hypothetical protein